MFDLFFADPVAFAADWYRWGAALGMATTVVVTSWVFWDSQRGGYAATYWRVFSLVAAMIVTPSAVLSFFPDLATGLGNLPILLAYLGVLASVVSLMTLVLYAVGVGITHADASHDTAVDELEFPVPAIAPEVAAMPAPPARSGGVLPTTGRMAPIEPTDAGAAMERTQRLAPAAVAEPDPLAWLVVMNGPQAGRTIRLGRLTDIGRDAGRNDVALDDPTISRQHARVRLEKGEFVLYDLASANGVSVNGEKVQRQTLTNKDRILAGQTELGFMLAPDVDTSASA